MDVKGIDISHWNGSIDFKKVRNAGYDFVIIAAGYGRVISQKDAFFEENYKGAKAAGLKVGAYWYSYAVSESDARLEARTCIEAIKGKVFEFPIWYDIEEELQFAKGKVFCSAITRAFCDEMKKGGYYSGLYISRSPLQSFINEDIKKTYPLWVAEYNSKLNYTGHVDMWQYTENGRINGLNCDFDIDVNYTDFPALIAFMGMNGMKKEAEKPKQKTSKKTIEELADEVIAGKWGNGSERKRRLTAEGYSYEQVQKKVNEKLTKKKSVQDVAKEVIAGKWGNGTDRKNRLTAAGYDYAAVQAEVNRILG